MKNINPVAERNKDLRVAIAAYIRLDCPHDFEKYIKENMNFRSLDMLAEMVKATVNRVGGDGETRIGKFYLDNILEMIQSQKAYLNKQR